MRASVEKPSSDRRNAAMHGSSHVTLLARKGLERHQRGRQLRAPDGPRHNGGHADFLEVVIV